MVNVKEVLVVGTVKSTLNLALSFSKNNLAQVTKTVHAAKSSGHLSLCNPTSHRILTQLCEMSLSLCCFDFLHVPCGTPC